MRNRSLLLKQSFYCLTPPRRILGISLHTDLALAMAPKILYDAAEMQTKADEAAEKEIQSVTREGVELPPSAEVSCEYLGVLKDDGFTLDARPTLRSTVGYKWSYRDKMVDVTAVSTQFKVPFVHGTSK